MMLDASFIVYTVLALIPNILLILFVMAGISRKVRLLTSRFDSIEREMKMIDESIKQVAEDLQRAARRTPAPGAIEVEEAEPKSETQTAEGTRPGRNPSA